MFQHTEHCDHCMRQIGHRDGGDYNWYGLRFRQLEPGSGTAKEQRQRMPDDYIDYEISRPIGFSINMRSGERTAQGHPKGSYSSGPSNGFVMPGVLCSRECFVEWMENQIEQALAKMDKRLTRIASPDATETDRDGYTPRAVTIED